jgi:site-specific recombinase XerD
LCWPSSRALEKDVGGAVVRGGRRQRREARYGHRLNGLIVVLWRAGLRINEALSLTETDVDERRRSIRIRHGRNDRRRELGMDPWRWSALQPWLAERAKLPVGPLFCVIVGPTRGHAGSATAARLELHRTAIDAGVRRRLAPHQLRHAHAVACCAVLCPCGTRASPPASGAGRRHR